MQTNDTQELAFAAGIILVGGMYVFLNYVSHIGFWGLLAMIFLLGLMTLIVWLGIQYYQMIRSSRD